MTRNITMTSRKVLAILLSAAMLVSVAVVAIVHSTRSNAATPSSQLYVGYNEEDGNWYAYNITTGEIQGDYTGIAELSKDQMKDKASLWPPKQSAQNIADFLSGGNK